MCRLGCREDPFCFRKLDRCFKGSLLFDRNRLDVTGIIQRAKTGGHTMIAQPTCMDGRRDKVMSQCVHLDDWSHFCSITIIECVDSLCEGWSGSRLHGQDTGAFAVLQVLAHERIGNASEV